jgi:hypothetical protein
VFTHDQPHHNGINAAQPARHTPPVPDIAAGARRVTANPEWSNESNPRRLIAFARSGRETTGVGTNADSEMQFHQIDVWAISNGHTIVARVAETDRTGQPAEDTLLGLIQAIHRREADGVVVTRFDLFGRTSLDLRFSVGRLLSSGMEVVSCAEGEFLSPTPARSTYVGR